MENFLKFSDISIFFAIFWWSFGLGWSTQRGVYRVFQRGSFEFSTYFELTLRESVDTVGIELFNLYWFCPWLWPDSLELFFANGANLWNLSSEHPAILFIAIFYTAGYISGFYGVVETAARFAIAAICVIRTPPRVAFLLVILIFLVPTVVAARGRGIRGGRRGRRGLNRQNDFGRRSRSRSRGPGTNRRSSSRRSRSRSRGPSTSIATGSNVGGLGIPIGRFVFRKTVNLDLRSGQGPAGHSFSKSFNWSPINSLVDFKTTIGAHKHFVISHIKVKGDIYPGDNQFGWLNLIVGDNVLVKSLYDWKELRGDYGFKREITRNGLKFEQTFNLPSPIVKDLKYGDPDHFPGLLCFVSILEIDTSRSVEKTEDRVVKAATSNTPAVTEKVTYGVLNVGKLEFEFHYDSEMTN